VTHAIALLMLIALQKSETSLPKLKSASAARSHFCSLRMEECIINGEITREHEHWRAVSDVLLSWLTDVLSAVL
jgi:hypothetical protein